MSIDQMRARLAEVRTELAEVNDADVFDEARWNDLSEEGEALVEKIEKAEERAAKIARVEAHARKPENVTSGDGARSAIDRDVLGEPESVRNVGRNESNPWDVDVRTAAPSELRERALSAIEGLSGASDSIRETMTRGIERGEGNLSSLVLITTSPEYTRAFAKVARGDTSMLSREEAAAWSKANSFARAMSTTDGSGGYLTPTQIDPAVTLSDAGSTNPIWDLARRVTVSSDTYRNVSAGSTSWSWDTEGAEVSDDASTFTNTDVPLYPARGFVPVSFEALHTIDNVTSIVADLLADGYDQLVGAALTTGSGSAQPTGIVTALTGGAQEQSSETTDVFASADVYATYEKANVRHRKRGSWLSGIVTLDAIRQFATDDGHALLARLGEGDPMRVLGRPWFENSDMDDTINGTQENRILVYGDFSCYVVAVGWGSMVEFVPQVFGANGRPTGQRGWFATSYLGADSVNDGAFGMLNVT